MQWSREDASRQLSGNRSHGIGMNEAVLRSVSDESHRSSISAFQPNGVLLEDDTARTDQSASQWVSRLMRLALP